MQSHTRFKISQIRQFYIKGSNEKDDCLVPGILELSPKLLLVTDWGNSSLKCIDTTSNTIISRLHMTARPWGITAIPESRIAVTFPDVPSIRFYNDDLGVSVNIQSIPTDGRYLDIQYIEKTFIVSCIDPQPQIQIVDLECKLLKKILNDESGNPLFVESFHFTIDRRREMIYVSDMRTFKCLSLTGDVKSTYQYSELMYPTGVATGSGDYIYICCKDIHGTMFIEVFTKGHKLCSLPRRHPNVKIPLTICCSRNKEILYLSSGKKEDSPCDTITALSVEFEDTDFERSTIVQDIQSTASSETNRTSESLSKDLKIFYLNVNGLDGRVNPEEDSDYLGSPTFTTFIEKYDLLCFAETNMKQEDKVTIDGYTPFVKARKQKSKRIKRKKPTRSGGIAIYVRNKLKPYVKMIDCDCEYILWIRLDYPAIGEPVILGAVYVPPKKDVNEKGDVERKDKHNDFPSTSKDSTEKKRGLFWREYIYSDFEQEIISKCAAFKNVVITGDFNCATSTHCYYTLDDASKDKLWKVNGIFERLSIPLNRSSMDKRSPCPQGNRLLKLCQSNCLFILNGRVPSDQGKGLPTCITKGGKSKTVNDYAIATGECFEFIKSFQVIETEKRRFTDVHDALVFELGSKTVA